MLLLGIFLVSCEGPEDENNDITCYDGWTPVGEGCVEIPDTYEECIDAGISSEVCETLSVVTNDGTLHWL